jgi:hypothetical protein
MGFSGGGSNVLKPHTHDGTVVQDGGSLDFNNITQSNSSAGEIFYSDGVHLQQLAYPGVPAGETLTAAAASTEPSWAAGGGAGSWELLGSDTAAAAAASLSVSGMTVKDILCVVLRTESTSHPAMPMIRINGISTGTYMLRAMENTALMTNNNQTGFQLSGNHSNRCVGFTLYFVQPDSNLASTGTQGWYSGMQLDQGAPIQISRVYNGGMYQPQTADITQIDALYTTGNVIGELTVYGADKT